MPANSYLAVMAFSGGSQGGLLDVNPGLIVWTVVIFVFLLLILKKVAWKPILTVLDERENFIKTSIEKAENAQKEAEKLIAENRANLAKAEEDAQKVIQQGREYAEKLKVQIIEESKNEAKKLIADATSEIERKNVEAFNKLKEQIAEIVIDSTEKLILENLDREKQSKIVNKFIEDLAKKN